MDDPHSSRKIIDAALQNKTISSETYDHHERVMQLAREMGGTERDLVAALLHEIEVLPEEHELPENVVNHLITFQAIVPDFFRHDDAELARRIKEMRTAPSPMKLLWLCDVIDSFENPRLEIMPADLDPEQDLPERCRIAREALSMIDLRRVIPQINRARSAIADRAMEIRAGLFPGRGAAP